MNFVIIILYEKRVKLVEVRDFDLEGLVSKGLCINVTFFTCEPIVVELITTITLWVSVVVLYLCGHGTRIPGPKIVLCSIETL